MQRNDMPVHLKGVVFLITVNCCRAMREVIVETVKRIGAFAVVALILASYILFS